MTGAFRMAEFLEAVRGAKGARSGLVEIEELGQAGKGGLRGAELEAGLAEGRNGLRNAGREVEAAEFEKGTQEARELFGREARGEISEAAAAREVEVARESMWDKAKSFGKVMAAELFKGAAMGLGWEAAAAGWKQLVELLKDHTFETRIAAVNKANEVQIKTLTDWSDWLSANWTKRDDYGVEKTHGVSISKFQIVQNQKSSLVDDRAKDVIPAVKLAANITTADGILPLVTIMKDYTKKMLDAAKDIRDTNPPMVSAGLKDHVDDLQKAYDSL